MNGYCAGRFSWRTEPMEFDEILYHETFSIHVSLQFNGYLPCACAFPITFWCAITQIRQMTIEFCVTQFTSAKNVCLALHTVYGFVS